MTHRRTKFLAGAVLAMLVVAACSGHGSGTRRTASLGDSSVFDPDRQAPAAPIEGAVAGGTVTVLSDGGYGLDPTEAYAVEQMSILSGLVTRSLTQYVLDPDTGRMLLVPDLATDIGTPNDDFTQWSFTIRDGVRFENGAEVTADDVAFGIKRSFDRKDFPSSASYSNRYFLDGRTYEGPYRSGTYYDGITVDGNTLTIKMARPFPDMPYWAAFPAMGPIRQSGSDPETYWRHPLATGPYMVEAFKPDQSLILVRNEHWDPSTDPGRHAYPDRYVFHFGLDHEQIDATILGHSRAGETTLTPANVLPGDYRTADELNRVTVGPGGCTRWWAPDYRKITDLRVREAIGYAFPYRDAAELVGDILGVTSLPGTSILSPAFPGRKDYNVLDTQPGRTDPKMARALLQQAGYSPGDFPLVWPYDKSDATAVKLNDLFVKSFQAAGFAPKPYATTSPEDFFQVNQDPDAPLNVRILNFICPDWWSGNSWLPQVVQSDGEWNYSFFSEPAVDKAIDHISALPLDQQSAAWGELDKTVMTDYYPVLITSYNGLAMLHGARIGGMNAGGGVGSLIWNDLYVMQ